MTVLPVLLFRTSGGHKHRPILITGSSVSLYILHDQCFYCNFMLPKQNFDYTEHSCFSCMDFKKETFYVDEKNRLFKGGLSSAKNSPETMPEEEELPQESEVHYNDFDVIGETGEDGQTEESYDNPPTEKKKCRNKQDKHWLEAEEILITAVQMRPCLWDHTIDVKKRSTLNAEAWLEVLKELKEDVKRRWRNLRDSFNKAKKKKTTYLPSGSAAPTTNDDSSFRHYESMLFLIDKVKPRPTKSNIAKKRSYSCDLNEFLSMSIASDVNTIEEPMEDSNSLSTSGINSNISDKSSFIEHTKRPRKKSEDVEFQKHLVNILPQCTCNKPTDGIDGFLIHLGDILRRLPYKESRALQKEIFDSAYKAEERAGLFTK
ncbi:PREDICTED: uncharacterized protein LOC105557869 isoform X2 [Vollenhovia emeryi]|uniref:uncharacterized protein LOC105557869 isoform X2 n=1 Tax=Vollenhovia emeryi TaxID=411798 RepID=UPI0005F39103|nr:PREDICTED: uncharacterized protein LOC105557869 isoform X2 [Vollenhovia emeryi]